MNSILTKTQRGAGLIEILISVLVLSIGLLGIAAMQIRSVKNNQSALEYSIALIQQQSIKETLMFARSSALAGKFNIGLEDDDYSGVSPNMPPSNKSEAEIFAENAVMTWRSSIKSLLGDSATSSIYCANEVCTIVLQWEDGRGSQESAVQTIKTETRL
jgi:type IV pilus assembly protein PilV